MSFNDETLTPGSIPPQSRGFLLRTTTTSDLTWVLGFRYDTKSAVKTHFGTKRRFSVNFDGIPNRAIDSFMDAKVQYLSLKCATDLGLDLTFTHPVPVKGEICEFDLGSATAERPFTFRELEKKPAWEDLQSLARVQASETDDSQAARRRRVFVDLCYRRVDAGEDQWPIPATHMVCHDESTLKELLDLETLATIRLTHYIRKSRLYIVRVANERMRGLSGVKDAPVWGYSDSPTGSQGAAETAETAGTAGTAETAETAETGRSRRQRFVASLRSNLTSRISS